MKKEEKGSVYSNGTGKGKGKEKEVYANDEADGPVYDGGNAWVGQKSVQREYDGDEEYHALYSQE